MGEKGRIYLKNIPLRWNWISKIRLAGTSAALVFAAVLVSAVITSQLAQAQTFTTLHSFDRTDGANPTAGLVQATNGDLYGTTYAGGPGVGFGTVFKITPGGTLTTLHNFDLTDGAAPTAGLVQATNGELYGTTYFGGANNDGAVFKITPSGTLTTLYSFCSVLEGGICTDGMGPYYGALVQATNGELYGTTYVGGASNDCGLEGCGTVFKITPSGTLTTVHSFDLTQGAYLGAGLVQTSYGNLYGITGGGGANDNSEYCPTGCGTVFKITPGGTLTTLHSFDVTDGYNSYEGLVQATNGALYGTTLEGGNLMCGVPTGCGTIFKITPSGTLTTLHSFDGTDGVNPYGALVQATDGDLYGTTQGGGVNGLGTVFKITPTGTLTTLHSFGGTDGAAPNAALIQATDGNFYGTTYALGANDDGTVFSLSVGLGPFVETQTTSGKVGATVKILGTDLTGATSVTFNGTAATFKVVSKSEIATIVPAGATTGTVEVTIPSGTLKSNTKFHVIP
jgi:uncharacterized repeat protein (TIGR03803 family)